MFRELEEIGNDVFASFLLGTTIQDSDKEKRSDAVNSFQYTKYFTTPLTFI